MKVPADKHAHPSYTPYPVTSPRSFHPPPLPQRGHSVSSASGRQSQPPATPLQSAEPGGAPPAPASGASAAATAGNYKVARAISSCTRCRSRKQKCDGKLPACTACERAKVECIGFDAISKTNISRNYLYSLEQEIASLRAQVTALTAADPIGRAKKDIAATAHQAVSAYRSEFPIDPSLLDGSGESRPRSPYESPASLSHGHDHSHRHHHHGPGSSHGPQRRHSAFPFPTTPLGSDSPRSPFFSGPGSSSSASGGAPGRPHPTGQATSLHATSLTRMVHDAALRTGHAANSGGSLNVSGSTASGSDRGSVHGGVESPITTGEEGHGAAQTSPEASGTPRSAGAGAGAGGKRHPSASPLGASAALSVSSGGKPKRKFTVPPLPPRPAVERLVAAYVDFVGVTGPIIHIPTLGRQLVKIREGVDVEEGDIFVVMMVLALSTMASSRFVEPPDELRACSEAFHAEAMKHLDAVFEEQSYVGLQAILLLVWYSLLNPDKGSIWFLVGLATRTCVDLGYHNEHNVQVDQLDALELDMRRRLFWCTYKMDRLLSQSLGRPPSIPDGFINVPLPSELHDIDILPGHYGPLTGEKCSYKAVFLHTTKLRQLQSEILFNAYGVHGSTGRLPSQEWLDDCYERLNQWHVDAPEPRGTVSREGYAISFHNSCLLLFRPSPGCPRPGRKALSIVLRSSGYIIRIYRRMQLNDRISWLWMTSHFSFMAGLSFLYSYFNLYSMGGGEDVPTIDDAMMNIESCLGVLEYLAPRVPSASACHDTMRALSQAIFKQLSDLDPPPTAGHSSPRSSLLRGAPISSSREDPLPNEAFPAPLPAVTLPYELSLLDNLFRNPMASHSKASDYTSNKGLKGKAAGAGVGVGAGVGAAVGAAVGAGVNGGGDGSGVGGSGPGGEVEGYQQSSGFPPGAFHATGESPYGHPHSHSHSHFHSHSHSHSHTGSHAHNSRGQNTQPASSAYGDPNTLMGTFGMAAHLGMGMGPGAGAGAGDGAGAGAGGAAAQMLSLGGGAGSAGDGGVGGAAVGAAGGLGGLGMSNGTSYNGQNGFAGVGNGQDGGNMGGGLGLGVGDGGEGGGGFDIFSFLMDEEGGLGGNGYPLDVPADFSLWS